MCMSVRLSVRERISRTTRPIFTRFLCTVHTNYGRGSVVLWRRCDRLCTSGFVDDVTFAMGNVKRRMLKRTRHEVAELSL